MDIDFKPVARQSLAAQIADAIREAILSGRLEVGDRLPSEAELGAKFGVSRPTVREALKRLAAQNLIRTARGQNGGAFICRMDWSTLRAETVSHEVFLLSMSNIDFATACTARFALERAALPMAIRAVNAEAIAALEDEILVQSDPTLSDEGFCASDVAFHRRLVETAANPVLTFHAASAIEAMQPLMNMLTYRARDRDRIIRFHRALVAALIAGDAATTEATLDALADYTLGLEETMRNRLADKK